MNSWGITYICVYNKASYVSYIPSLLLSDGVWVGVIANGMSETKDNIIHNILLDTSYPLYHYINR